MAGYPQKPYPYPTQANTYPAPPSGPHHQTIIVQQQRPVVVGVPVERRSNTSQAAGFIGGVIGSAVRSGSQLVSDVARETVNEIDRYAESPLLDCFKPGCGIQLRNKCSAGCVKVQPNGVVDSYGTVGNDYTAHFVVVSRYENKVVLRNAAIPSYHLAMANGMVVGTGIGDQASSFRIHETLDHYVTLQHTMTGNFFGIDKKGQVVPPIYLNRSKDECKFEVHLAYSPFGHRYTPTH